jgi:type I restriction enzyme R subunit
VEETTGFLKEQGIESQEILDAEGFDRLKLLDNARDFLVGSEETKRKFLSLSANVARLYKAILPDPEAAEFALLTKLFVVLTERIRILDPEIDISGVMEEVMRVLDESIAARSFVIPDSKEDEEPVDLSRIDFEALRKRFEQGRKHTEAERLRGRVNSKLKRMVRLNKTRTDYQEQLQRLIEEYNAGSLNIEIYFKALINIAQELDEEDQRAISEGLSEEELAVFDILTKPEISLTDQEKEEIKKIARDLLETLKREKLVLDWRKRQQARASVRVTVLDGLDRLPPAYTDEMYQEKSELVYQHIYDHYYGQGRSVYAEAS